ncbi:Protein hinderin [Merluccius polli]|uniref:Protein hinderin n=1 Tax=Merluccius polli TaxID=89951 RepID=A0AA47P2S7_MERPO|nr:Protein hinderin [Merluccius polli]
MLMMLTGLLEVLQVGYKGLIHVHVLLSCPEPVVPASEEEQSVVLVPGEWDRCPFLKKVFHCSVYNHLLTLYLHIFTCVVSPSGVSRGTKLQFPQWPGVARSSGKVAGMRGKPAGKIKGTEVEKSRLQSAPSLTLKAPDLLHPSAAAPATHHTTSAYAETVTPWSQTNTTRNQTSLKDLCPEDKRLSEEKDESAQRLRDEQETFESKIQQLEQQNVLIVQERESLQQQYRECQELLGLYQRYLSQQQEKLNQSIAQLHSKVSASEAGTGRTASTLDGSRPGPDPGPEGRPGNRRRDSGGKRAAKACGRQTSFSDPTSLDSSSGESGPVRVCAKQRTARRGCEHCLSNGARRTKPRRTREEDPFLVNGDRSCCGPQDCTRPSGAEAAGPQGGPAALTDPLLGPEDWEEKRHQLFLQKLQLEAEKERLRARLAEQEERLARQGQQLRQSRLDYSRFQHATQVEPASSITGSGAPLSERPSDRHLFFGECEAPPQTSADSLEKQLPPLDALRYSRQDMATSPVTAVASVPEPTPAAALTLKSPEDG